MAVDRPIDVEPQHLKTLLGLLAQYLPDTTVWAFGSRVKWTSRPDSDLDLVVFAKEDQHPKVYQLKEALEESNLPFRVDVLVWDVISEAFHNNIRQEYVVLTTEKIPEWPLEELDAIADEVTVGYVGPMASEYVESGIPFLRSLNIEQFRLNKNDVKFITPDFHRRIKKSALKPGDVVIVRTGKPGTCAVIPDWLTDANCSDLVIVRCSQQIRPRFLCYWVNSVAAHHIDAHTVGAVQQHFNVGAAKKMKVAVPSLSVQDEIVAVLGALDDRITLLRETNATLEAIAQALFKSWFVDFGPVRAKQEGRAPEGMDATTAALFPDSFEESERGLVPRGWRVGALSDLAALNPESWTTKKHPKTLAYIDLANTKDNEISEITNYLFENAPSRARRVLREGDTIIGTVRPGNRSFAYIQYPPRNLTASTGFAVLRPKQVENSGYIFLAATQDSSIEHLAHIADGGAYPAVRPEVVTNIQTVLPYPEVMTAFHEVTSPLLVAVAKNHQQAQTLASLRDTLLPRLISGQLRLPEAQAHVEESAA